MAKGSVVYLGSKKCRTKLWCEKQLQKEFTGEYSDVLVFLMQCRGPTGQWVL